MVGQDDLVGPFQPCDSKILWFHEFLAIFGQLVQPRLSLHWPKAWECVAISFWSWHVPVGQHSNPQVSPMGNSLDWITHDSAVHKQHLQTPTHQHPTAFHFWLASRYRHRKEQKCQSFVRKKKKDINIQQQIMEKHEIFPSKDVLVGFFWLFWSYFPGEDISHLSPSFFKADIKILTWN